MPIFLITFITIYGGMHAYVFVRLHQTFSPELSVKSFLIGWMVLMTFAPLLVHQLEGAGLQRAALWVAWPGYTWMGCIFIFCSILITLDVVRAFIWLANYFAGTGIPGFATSAITCELAIFLAIITSGYALYEAIRIRTEHITVTNTRSDSQIDRLRIVQISDVHIGLLFRESRLESVLKVVRAANPDILISTGDLVDGRLSREDTSHLNQMAAMISAVPTKTGKFAVTGNHEFYAGIKPSLSFMRAAGFTVLRNQSSKLIEGINITGIDDIAGNINSVTSLSTTESELLKSIPANNFRLLLKHRPDVYDTSDGHFDLQLSGHIHKGQIFPFNILVKLKFPIPSGTTTTNAGSLIHVSRGTGTWGPPMRLFAPPEVTIIDIIPHH